MMKTADELLVISNARDDWKHLKMWAWANEFEEKFDEWRNIMPPVRGDRRTFIETYKTVYDALDSLPDNPNEWVCCAVSEKMRATRRMMNEIIEKVERGQTDARRDA